MSPISAFFFFRNCSLAARSVLISETGPDHVQIRGRRAGILAFLFTHMGLDLTMSLELSESRIELIASSLSGRLHEIIPLTKISSVGVGYSKPVLALVLAPKQLYLNLILETIGYAGLTGVNMIRYPWVYFGDTMKPMIWSRILAGSGFDLDFGDSSLYQLVLAAHTHPQTHGFVNAMFVAALAAIAYTTYPNSAKVSVKRLPDGEDCRDVLVIRFLMNAVICLLPIISVFI